MKTYKSFEMFLKINDDIKANAKLLNVGNIFYYMNGVYITLQKTNEHIYAKRLDKKESIKIPNDTIINHALQMDK